MELSKSDCNVLKGWAIMAIMIHNYCGWLPNAATENEFTWKIEKTNYFFFHFYDSCFTNLFSFLGHYGVVIFIFISAYGLVKKYEAQNIDKISGVYFIGSHYIKLTKLLIVGISLYWTVYYLLHSEVTGTSILQLTAQLTYTVNLIPMKLLGIYPGPYWYFGLTMELYLIYRLFIYRNKTIVVLTICICCFISLYLSNGHYQTQTWIKLNFIGSMVPFTIGVLFARGLFRLTHYSFLYTYLTKQTHVYKSILFIIYKIKSRHILRMISCITLCCILFVALLFFERNYYLWLFISLPIILITISMTKLCNKCSRKFWEKIGCISNFLFIIHPIIREIPLAYRDNMIYYPHIYLMLYLICTFIMVIPFKYLLSTIDRIQAKVFQ